VRNTETPQPYPTQPMEVTPFPPTWTPTVTLPPTQTKTPTTSIRTIPITNTIPTCPGNGILIQPPAGFGLPGTIIYQGEKVLHGDYIEGTYITGAGLYSVGGSPLIYSKLPVDQTQKYDVFGVSPDGNWLAFSPVSYDSEGNVIYGDPKIGLLSASGEVIENTLASSGIYREIPEGFLQGGLGFGDWINNDLLYGYYWFRVRPELTLSRYEGRSSVIDPFKGVVISDLLTNLDNLDASQSMAFSPDMRRVLYRSTDGLVLYNLVNSQAIWSEKVLIPQFGVRIDWSPDSLFVAYAVQGITQNNTSVSILTHDGRQETIILDPSDGYQMWSMSWSPDSQNLAFAINNEADELSVYIYNLQTSQYVYQCPIVGTDFIGDLYWSPDTQYLAYGYFGTPIQVLNLHTGDIFELADIGVPVGWSDKFPTAWP
jgi:WD40 repeat protein